MKTLIHKTKFFYIILTSLLVISCSNSDDDNDNLVAPSFKFTHNWDGDTVTNSDFNTIQYTNAKGDNLSIERLRYVISDITFSSGGNTILVVDYNNLVDLTNNRNLVYQLVHLIPAGTYDISFTFGLDNEDNAENDIVLNSESFNVPDFLGGGYHYMQFDGKFINASMQEQGFNYHAIRAVDNPGPDPSFPQDTFFNVNLGSVTIGENTQIEVKMNIAEWFKNPNEWDLNDLNQMLMPNSSAQIMMFENGQNVFSLGTVTN